MVRISGAIDTVIRGSLVVLLLGPAAAADRAEVTLNFDPPGPAANRLTITLTATASGITKSDTDTTDISGWLGTILTATANHATHEARVTGLEFIGGDVSASDLSFTLNYFLIGSIRASGTGLGGTATTFSPPGSVTGQTFPTQEHAILLNRGVFHAYGTGVVGGLFDPVTVHLADEPITATSLGTGKLLLGPPADQAGRAVYDVTLEMPLDVDETVVDDGGTSARVTGDGLVRARGQMSLPVAMLGDLDGSGAVNAADIDVLYGHLPSTDPAYDVNGDWAVDQQDADTLVHDVLGSEYGDADLDGDVDVWDYLTLKVAATREPPLPAPGWADANFDGLDGVGYADYVLARDHFGWSAGPRAPSAAIPEPATLTILSLAALGLLRARRRSHSPTTPLT